MDEQGNIIIYQSEDGVVRLEDLEKTIIDAGEKEDRKNDGKQ